MVTTYGIQQSLELNKVDGITSILDGDDDPIDIESLHEFPNYRDCLRFRSNTRPSCTFFRFLGSFRNISFLAFL